MAMRSTSATWVPATARSRTTRVSKSLSSLRGDILGIGDFLAVLRIDGIPMEVTRPEAPAEHSTNLDDTPAHGSAPTERATLPVQSDSDDLEDIEADLDKTIAKKGMGSLLAGSDEGESSIFDFDFDFEDDDNPQL